MPKKVNNLYNNTTGSSSGGATTQHPDYIVRLPEWERVRDCMKGEQAIKNAAEKYLPRPAGMSGEYAEAYNDYIERAHFPLVTAYALQGVLGIIITKLPEFNFPKELEYLIDNATRDGRDLRQLFLDVIIEIMQTGRVPLVVDLDDSNPDRFTIVQYKAEDLINWKSGTLNDERTIQVAVIRQKRYKNPDNIFSHETEDYYRVMRLIGDKYTVVTYDSSSKEVEDETVVPEFFGNNLDKLPIVIAGSISNAPEVQPIPLIPVANCAIQIYRKQADLANSEFLSCNPTLCISGAEVDSAGDVKNVPNVVGSSVLFALPDSQARVYYTTTDTAALNHVAKHIDTLYEEAIRHGVAILDARKGVEAAEALRIRQATQSASVYSIYLSALSAIRSCLEMMCEWGGYDVNEVVIDAPSSLVLGTPDANVMRELATGVGNSVYPLQLVHRYLVSSGLLDQTISFEEYVTLLEEDHNIKNYLNSMPIVPDPSAVQATVNYGSGDPIGNQDFKNRFEGKFQGHQGNFESSDRYQNWDKNGSQKRRRKTGGLVSEQTSKVVAGTQNKKN